LFPKENEEIEYEIYSQSSNGAEKVTVVHGQGTAVLNTFEEIPTLDIEFLKAECDLKKFGSDECYEAFAKVGLEYGAGYRGIEKIYVGEDQALAKLTLPSSVSDTADRFTLHPGMLDSALQASGLIIEGLPMIESGKPEPLLPFALQRIEVFRECTFSMWAFLRFIKYDGENRSEGGKVKKLDIDLCDEQGNICVRMQGMKLHGYSTISTSFSKKVTPSRQKEPSELMTFEEYWQEKEIVHVASDIGIRTLVCFLTKPENRKIAAEAVKKLAPETQIIFISQSDSYKKESRNHHSVSKTDGKTFQKAFASIIEDYGNIDAVFYMAAIENSEAARDYSGIVHIIQAMAAVELKSGRFLATARLSARPSEVPGRCYPESWIGFERSLGLIMPNMQFGVIYEETESFSKNSIGDWVEILWQELQGEKISSALYKENKRLVYRIRETIPEDSESLIKQEGTYLITGGCGGLGALLARYLAKKHPVKLILTGRSPIDDKKRVILKSIEESGSRVIYIQADVCDYDAMKKGLKTAVESFGKIDGVIHAAGVESKRNILEKDMESFNEVLRPKIEGTLVLDKILKKESPEFICYFSSSSAILGDFGACDYAIANRFLMSYAAHKNKIGRNELGTKEKNIVINWPLWKEGGMGSDSDDSLKMYLK